ncbi:hypothetical protein [Blastochloris tepida]|uniref:Uncharacterized protein n=1 Tax=Blastochloris tepida TaxID=2233851 RepID=A0A348G5S6_9HYPH|nr:hypothetical protein [Blastochloris tepida]BBF94909.1 hypothetical protein BLTE_35940 [Blastochloris tepida]
MTFTTSHICKAFNLNPVSLRRWMNDPNYPLRVEARSEESAGWRRFNMADAVRISLVSRLINNHSVESWNAVYAVNSIYDLISIKVPEFLAAAQANGNWFQEQTCFVMFFRMDDDPAFHRVFDTIDGLVEAATNRSISGTILFELWSETLRAASNLQTVPPEAQQDLGE